MKEVIAKGIPASLGQDPPTYSGSAYVAKSLKEANAIPEGYILVVETADMNLVLASTRAQAVVTESGGMTSALATTLRKMKKPGIVGAKNVLKGVTTGDYIYLDVRSGEIYKR